MIEELTEATEKKRRAVVGESPTVLSEIYQEDVNISVWERKQSPELQKAVSDFLQLNPTFEKSMTVSAEEVRAELQKVTDGTAPDILIDSIAELVDMFCFLFELKRAGVRLATLDRAMCPRFHVDRVPCRLVTTYQGIATQWLLNKDVDRSKLGQGSNGLPDEESGLFSSNRSINQLRCGDVALLKGESWYNNENMGLVHRSPAVPDGECRLLLTMDFSD